MLFCFLQLLLLRVLDWLVTPSEVVFWELPGLFILLFLSVVLITVLFCVNILVSFLILRPARNANQRFAAYECGFDAFADARMRFDVRYYLVAILFLLFDIEIIFVLPWAMFLPWLSSFGFWSMELFLIIVTLGFVYEYLTSALDWETV